MHVKEFLLNVGQLLSIGRKLLCLVSIIRVIDDYFEQPLYEYVLIDFHRFLRELLWEMRTDFHHVFIDVGTLLSHGDDFTPRLQLLKVLFCHVYRTTQLNDLPLSQSNCQPQRNIYLLICLDSISIRHVRLFVFLLLQRCFYLVQVP